MFNYSEQDIRDLTQKARYELLSGIFDSNIQREDSIEKVLWPPGQLGLTDEQKRGILDKVNIRNGFRSPLKDIIESLVIFKVPEEEIKKFAGRNGLSREIVNVVMMILKENLRCEKKAGERLNVTPEKKKGEFDYKGFLFYGMMIFIPLTIILYFVEYALGVISSVILGFIIIFGFFTAGRSK